MLAMKLMKWRRRSPEFFKYFSVFVDKAFCIEGRFLYCTYVGVLGGATYQGLEFVDSRRWSGFHSVAEVLEYGNLLWELIRYFSEIRT
jgi:hypothetical protein